MLYLLLERHAAGSHAVFYRSQALVQKIFKMSVRKRLPDKEPTVSEIFAKALKPEAEWTDKVLRLLYLMPLNER